MTSPQEPRPQRPTPQAPSPQQPGSQYPSPQHHGPRQPGPRRPPAELHLDVGAYVLGVLEPADRAEFEEHLAGCADCTAEVGQLGGLEPLLAELADAGLPSGSDGSGVTPRPSDQLLDRLVGEVSATRRRSRTRRLALVAAAAVLIVAGPVATAALTGGAVPPPAVAVAVAQQFSATDPANGSSATVGVTPESWGSRISLSFSTGTLQGPVSCDLVAVSHHGERQTVTTWSVPPAGYSTLRTTGGAGLSPSDIDHFEIRTLDTANRLLVTVPTAPGGS
ncbi:zf-HC2 domain-containing protein [Kitasatospora sp. MAP5-34]|uniref:anti-sigma factor family protein n=1 Tax=Kitasatospora sp. MAP5-34 TaxID=3035102 RepID=UPI0024766310|nr:zf-HC2 domain-containing protein [Kitasatospora sp. MAP5-34]MDH6576115.1 hypothetical protein [Kitasatospora sp. MAP5-34]